MHEEMALMQGSVKPIDKVRVVLGSLQRGLDKERSHRVQKVKGLQRRLLERHGPGGNVPTEIAELQAVLVVLEEDEYGDGGQTETEADREYVCSWWEQLRRHLPDLEVRQRALEGTGGATFSTVTFVDLETQGTLMPGKKMKIVIKENYTKKQKGRRKGNCWRWWRTLNA